MYTKENLAGKTVEELAVIILEQSAAIATKEGELKAKQKELDLTVKVNGDLTAKVEKLSKNAPAAAVTKPESAISDKTFTHDNKEYGFKKIRVSLGNDVITAKEVLASESLQKRLVELGSGMIYEKTK